MESRKWLWASRAMKLLVAALFLLWFIPFAHERITTPASRAPDDFSDLIAHYCQPQEGDATKEWVAALAAMPPDPVFDEPPPDGMRWDFQKERTPPPMLYDPTDMLAGEWDPQSRPTLRVWIRFVGSAPVNSALESLTALRDRPWSWELLLLTGGSAQIPPGVNRSAVRSAAKFFVSRARFHREHRGDINAAWEDLKTTLRIARVARSDMYISMLVNVACETLALRELGYMARDVALPAELARDMEQSLQSLVPAESMWREATDGELTYGLHLIAGLFSDEGNGDGRLVLNAQPDLDTWLMGTGGAPSPSGRSRLWNLLSPLYNDRRTVVHKLEAHWRTREDAIDLDYRDAQKCLYSLGQRPLYGPMDGLFLNGLAGWNDDGMRGHLLLLRQVALRRATRLMLALNRYRCVHRRYPTQLSELVPALLDELPLDPFCGGTFGYRLDGQSGYVLYSCGLDGVDDGGGSVRRTAEEEGYIVRAADDDIYPLQRRAPMFPEPSAVPLSAAEPGNAEPQAVDP